ncbi:YhgE/Pip family protein [Isoptericola jiangsuensis]|uniref:YhgE/Pip family protein n=1 Tax=Isoptericola jiangsuensis TaxID=548579 RepID=UPI003AB0ED4C
MTALLTPLRLAASEGRRLAAGTMPRLAILAMALIPTLYAGLYLFANHDPYGNLEEVPAALVVLDEGATTTDSVTGETTERTFGEDVAADLLDDGGFGWVETTQRDAETGVRSGRFDAALVIGPTFSADLVSSGELEPRQASLTLLTNDANNYLAGTIADQIVGQVRDAVAQEVGTEAADEFLRGFASIHTNLADAVDGAEQLLDGSQDLADGARDADDGAHDLADGATRAADGAAVLDTRAAPLADATTRLDDGAQQLDDGLGDLQDATSSLPSSTRELADGAQQVADGNAEVAATGRQAADAAAQVLPALDGARDDVDAALADGLDALVADGTLTQDQADALAADVTDRVTPALDDERDTVTDAVGQVQDAADQLDTLADGAQQVADGAAELAAATPDLTDGIASAADGAGALADGTAELAGSTPALLDGVSQLADGTAQVASGAGDLADGTGRLADGAGDLTDGTTELRDGLAEGLGQVPDVDDDTRTATADTLGNPVEVRDEAFASAGTYGGGLAPFFLSLATWIGAYVLFLLVRPLSSRALAAGRSGLAAALGGWLVPAVLGAVQMAVMLGVTTFALDITPEHGLATAAFLVLVSGTFVAVLQALNVWLGAAGQFLGLVLMLVQLVTAGGTFPWQTIPEPLRALHQFLPMTYAVEGLRQLLYGGSLTTAAAAAGVLAGVLVVALGATTLAARRQRTWSVTRLQPELVL